MTKKTLSRNPSFTPSPSLRQNLESRTEGTTKRLNQIWDRYKYLQNSMCITLTPEEQHVLHDVLAGKDVEPIMIAYLDSEILDSKQYRDGLDAALSLYGKLEQSNYAELLATVEKLGF